MEINEIGVICSPFREKFGTPRQPGLVTSAYSFIQLHKEFKPEQALDGLEKFTHVWILFLFHQNTNVHYNPKVYPPRLEGQRVGVFSSRSPHRPNPIGLSVAKIEKIENGILYLSGTDLVDQTPILDIKPYVPEYDLVLNASNGWLTDANKKTITVLISDSIKSEITNIFSRSVKNAAAAEKLLLTHYTPEKVILLIQETIAQDPRPVSYREKDREGTPYKKEYAITLMHWNVFFEVIDDGITCATATVTRVEYID